MKNRANKIFWGILLLLSALVAVLYGAGFGAEAFGIPFYKIILSIVIISIILSKVIFSHQLRGRLKIFLPLAFLFMVLEKDIAEMANLADTNIINNWLLIFAAILADCAIVFLVPKTTVHKGHHNKFSSTTHYIDANETKISWVDNKMGDTTVYYQNTDIADIDSPLELNIINKMGNVTVHVPNDWVIDNQVVTKMGEMIIRPNTGSGITLVIKGENKMGDIEII